MSALGNPDGLDLPAVFDRLADQDFFAGFEPGEEERTARLLDRMDLQPGLALLEPGCGMGRFTRLLIDRIAPGGTVLAIDVSPRFIRRAREFGCPPGVEYRCEDFFALPAPSASCDGIVFYNVFPHLAKQTALDRTYDLLRPGGRTWILHSCSREFVNDIHRNAESSQLREHLIPDDEQIRQMLAGSGFSVNAIDSSGDTVFCEAVRPL